MIILPCQSIKISEENVFMKTDIKKFEFFVKCVKCLIDEKWVKKIG